MIKACCTHSRKVISNSFLKSLVIVRMILPSCASSFFRFEIVGSRMIAPQARITGHRAQFAAIGDFRFQKEKKRFVDRYAPLANLLCDHLFQERLDQFRCLKHAARLWRVRPVVDLHKSAQYADIAHPVAQVHQSRR